MHLITELIQRAQIRSEYGIPTSTLNRWIKLGIWPKPIKLGGKSVWRRIDIEQFLETKAGGAK
jgi:predicted DNA-binding transcriptional regulator AlpA